jgi:hypothetical protein
MYFLFMRKHTKCVQQSHQAKIMIAMKMGNKNMGDLSSPDLVFDHLDLRSFPAINQVVGAIVRYNLAGGMAIERRYR